MSDLKTITGWHKQSLGWVKFPKPLKVTPCTLEMTAALGYTDLIIAESGQEHQYHLCAESIALIKKDAAA